jgi:hypothetical protein
VRLLSMHSIFLSFILLVYLLYYIKIKVVVDATVHSEHGKVIQCEIKPGSVEKSIGVSLTAGRYLNPLPSIKIEKTHSG